MISLHKVSQSNAIAVEVAEYGVVTLNIRPYPAQKPCLLRYVGGGMVEFLCDTETGEPIYLTIPGLSAGTAYIDTRALAREKGVPWLQIPKIADMKSIPTAFLRDYEVEMSFALEERTLQVRFGRIGPASKIVFSERVEFVVDNNAIVAMNIVDLDDREHDIVRHYVIGSA